MPLANPTVLPHPGIRPAGVQVHPGRQRYLVLDGIRGLAILAVLLTHASYLFQIRLFARLFELGWSGVDLFFVLSGFLITGILIDTKAALNRARSFYARRVLRIFPIYYLTLLIVLLAQGHWDWLSKVADMPTTVDRLAYLLYFEDLATLWHHGGSHQSLLSHFWSLAVEEQFYLIWPFLVWRLSSKAVYQVCGAALLLTLLAGIIAGSHFGFGPWIQFFPLTRADGLFVGSALAALLSVHGRIPRKVLAALALFGVLTLLLVLLTGHDQFYYGGPYLCTIGYLGLAILCGVLIASCLEFHDTPVARFFRQGWLRSFGRYSYGIYVFHLPIYYLSEHLLKDQLALKFPPSNPLFAFAYTGLLIALSYGLAWLSFEYLEQPFLRLKRHYEPVFATAHSR